MNEKCEKKPKVLYAQINKNFLNMPLARDVRTAPEWWFSKKPGRWFCNVSRNPKVTLWLPSWTDEGLYRCPTARDMNVFTYLLGAGTLAMEPARHEHGFAEGKRYMESVQDSREQRSRDIKEGEVESLWADRWLYAEDGKAWEKPEVRAGRHGYKLGRAKAKELPPPEFVEVSIRSWAALSRTLGYSPNDPKVHRALEVSLRYWQNLSLGFFKWYVSKKFQHGQPHIRRILPPLIRSLNLPKSGRGKITISLRGEWIDSSQGNFAKIPVPIPKRSAAAVNLAFFLSAYSPSGATAPVRDLKTFCEKMSIPTDTESGANAGLDRALDVVNDWLSALDKEELTKARIKLPDSYRIDAVGDGNIKFIGQWHHKDVDEDALTGESGEGLTRESIRRRRENGKSRGNTAWDLLRDLNEDD